MRPKNKKKGDKTDLQVVMHRYAIETKSTASLPLVV